MSADGGHRAGAGGANGRSGRAPAPGGGFVLPPANGARPREGRGDDTEGIVAVLALGESTVPGGFTSWFAMALTVHALLFGWARATAALHEMKLAIAGMRAAQRDYFDAFYPIEIDEPKAKPPEPEPPPPEAVPEPQPVALAARPAAAPTDPYEPPPAPAQASKVLTSGEAPVDLTGQGFVTGEGTGPGYGQVSAAGTGSAPTYNPNAVVGGVPGGIGKGPPVPPPPPPGPDRSRTASLIGSTSWSDCPFPAEAEADQIDEAVVTVAVTVRPDGTPLSVRVVSDPGHGFGRQARICALGRRYNPGLDRNGDAITSTMPPINVRFQH